MGQVGFSPSAPLPPLTPDALHWTYALAPDVTVEAVRGGAYLCTATSRRWIEGSAGWMEVLPLVATGGRSENFIVQRMRDVAPGDDAQVSCAALLYHLDQLGLLTRTVCSAGRQLASCVPLRQPPAAPPVRPPKGVLRLSPLAVIRVENASVSIETPGAWAKLTVHDRELLPLLCDLGSGRSAAEIAAATTHHSREAIMAFLVLVSWCGLLDHSENAEWRGHDLLFHARTRRGYARVVLGKTGAGGARATQQAHHRRNPRARRIVLEPPDLARLLAEDPPHALVSERRHSSRRHGSEPLTSAQLSEFLFRTLHERGGRRPYPSAGACYPLKAWLAVHRCRGVAPGLYAYDEAQHELVLVGDPGSELDLLLADAAGAANSDTPQILLVLAARYGQTQPTYADLSYSLILKEVGAVFQVATMAAAAMGLSACPLGCGDSLLFSRIAGLNSLTETSVGELTLGSLT